MEDSLNVVNLCLAIDMVVLDSELFTEISLIRYVRL